MIIICYKEQKYISCVSHLYIFPETDAIFYVTFMMKCNLCALDTLCRREGDEISEKLLMVLFMHEKD